MNYCYFCDIQHKKDDRKFIENEEFFSRYDRFPVSKGHLEIVSKKHISSLFDLSPQQIKKLFELLIKSRKIVEEKYCPDGYNIGINEGEAAGQSVFHLHVHLIPRYKGDITNPRGGVRNIFPAKADYISELKPAELKKYFPEENKIYGKLVRDKIPEIIKSNGEVPMSHIASNEEFKQRLNAKLREEVKEYFQNHDEGELIDILEVVYALADIHLINRDKLEQLRKEKVKKRGGFIKRIILDKIEKNLSMHGSRVLMSPSLREAGK